LTLTGQYSYSAYQAGQWASGSYAYTSVSYTGTGNSTAALNETANSTTTGSGSRSGSSSGIEISGPSGSYGYNYSSTSVATLVLSSTTSYSLHEEGTYAGGSYNLGCMLHQGAGANPQVDWLGHFPLRLLSLYPPCLHTSLSVA
jgi:hypothetical protein